MRSLSLPGAIRIDPNIPNPFSQSTLIPYELPAAEEVSLRVYDISGRLLRVLEESARRGPGKHSVIWDGLDARGRRLPAGVYLCRLEVAVRTETRRLALLK